MRQPAADGAVTLVWHDWFATSNEGVIPEPDAPPECALPLLAGSFRQLTLAVTRDPAMLLWLSGTDNTKWSPNENYAFELMELFTLGAGRGYTERDVREQARALTGFRNDWREGVGPTRFRFDRERHDLGSKRIFGRRGKFDWRDAVGLCVKHPRHPSFFVTKLWGYFIPTTPPAATRRSLERLYVRSGYRAPVPSCAHSQAPALLRRPAMVKPPIVYTAELLRAQRGIDTGRGPGSARTQGSSSSTRRTSRAGTTTAGSIRRPTWPGGTSQDGSRETEQLDPNKVQAPFDADKLLDRALAYWGNPQLSAGTRRVLRSYTSARSGPPTRTGNGGAIRRSSRTPSAS